MNAAEKLERKRANREKLDRKRAKKKARADHNSNIDPATKTHFFQCPCCPEEFLSWNLCLGHLKHSHIEFKRSSGLMTSCWRRRGCEESRGVEEVGCSDEDVGQGGELKRKADRNSLLEPWKNLVALEKNAQEDLARERLESWPLERLAHGGFVLLHLVGQVAREPNVVRFFAFKATTPAAGDEESSPQFLALLPTHEFSAGDLVFVSNPEIELKGEARNPGRCSVVVTSVSTTMLEATVVDPDGELISALRQQGACQRETHGGGCWRLDKAFSVIPFERMRIALSSLPHPLGLSGVIGDALSPGFLGLSGEGTPPAPVTLPAFPPFSFPERETTQESCDSSSSVVSSSTSDPGLNESQKTSLEQCLDPNRPFTLVHGPPGTGKTRLLAGAILSLIEQQPQSSTSPGIRRVLVVAESNIAVDNICQAVLDQAETSRALACLTAACQDPSFTSEAELGSLMVRFGKESSIYSVALQTLADRDPRASRLAELREVVHDPQNSASQKQVSRLLNL